jgi:hypothetical protein
MALLSERISIIVLKLWKRYDDGRIDIPAFLKAAGLRYFQSPSKK